MVRYTEIDVSRNESAAREMQRRSGQQGVPQTMILDLTEDPAEHKTAGASSFQTRQKKNQGLPGSWA